MDALELAALNRATTALDHLMMEGIDATPARKAQAFRELMFCAFTARDPNDLPGTLKDSRNPLLAKAAAHITTDAVWADANIEELAASYVASIEGGSLLGALKKGARVLPRHFRHALVASGVTTDLTAEGGLKVVRQVNLMRNTEGASKVTSIVVLSQELVKAGGDAVRILFENELTRSILTGVNTAVTDALVDSNAGAVTGTGDPVVDLRAGLAAADPSNHYAVAAAPGVVAALALSDANRTGMGIAGGDFVPGVTVVPVVDIDYMIIIPTSRIALADFGLRVKPSGHASVNMSDSPSAPSTLVSLWQTDSFGILVESAFQIEPNSTHVVVVTPA